MFLFELTLQMWSALGALLGCCCSDHVPSELTSVKEEFESLLPATVSFKSAVVFGDTCPLGYHCHKRHH